MFVFFSIFCIARGEIHNEYSNNYHYYFLFFYLQTFGKVEHVFISHQFEMAGFQNK